MSEPSSSDLVRVPFQGEHLLAGSIGDRHFVSISHISSTIGFNPVRLFRLVTTHPVLSESQNLAWFDGERLRSIGEISDIIASAKRQSINLFLSITKIDFLLASVNPNALQNLAAREKLLRYQKECADVLYKYFSGQQRSGRGPRGAKMPRLVLNPLPFYVDEFGEDPVPFLPQDEFAIYKTDDPVGQRIMMASNVMGRAKIKNPSNLRRHVFGAWVWWATSRVRDQCREYWNTGTPEGIQNCWKVYLFAVGQIRSIIIANYGDDMRLRAFDYPEPVLEQAAEMMQLAWDHENRILLRDLDYWDQQWRDYQVRDLRPMMLGIEAQLAKWNPKGPRRIAI